MKPLSWDFFWSTKRNSLSYLLDKDSLDFQSTLLVRLSISSGVYPDEYNPPVIAPTLVPTIISRFTPYFSKTAITPIWAKPLAPPPLNTNAIFFLLYFSGNILNLVVSKFGFGLFSISSLLTRLSFWA